MKKAELETLLRTAIRMDDRATRQGVIKSIPVDRLIGYLEDAGYEHVGDHIADPSMSYWQNTELGLPRITLWAQDMSSCIESIARQKKVTTVKVLLEVIYGDKIPGIKSLDV